MSSPNRYVRGTLPLLISVLTLAAVPPATAGVTILEVGPSGTYASVDSALEAAISLAADAEVRIESAGSPYAEGVFVSMTDTWTHEITVSGGWDAAFDVQTLDPTLTVIDGTNTELAFFMDQGGGTVSISNLTLTQGKSTGDQGPGFYARVDDASLTLSSLFVSDSAIEATGIGIAGGGLSIVMSGTATVVLEDTVITGNKAETDSSSSGGGASFNVSDTADLTVRNVLFENNEAATTADNTSSGAGFYLTMFHSATAVFEDVQLIDNECTGTGAAFGCGASLVVGSGVTVGHPALTVRRLHADGNQNLKSSSNSAEQIDAIAIDADLVFTDSLVVRGNQAGAKFDAFDASSVLRVNNLTVADHPARGLRFEGNGVATSSLFNTIVSGNTPNESIVGTLTEGNNLFGTDPGFFSPNTGHYSLRQGAAALDAGNPSPPGGLGPLDVEMDTRPQGGGVDIGAYEGPCSVCILADGFESGDVLIWSP